MVASDRCRIFLETVKGLNGYLTVGKNVDVPACVALFCILYYTCRV
jgi:hypothetical protein